ncbi:hypothetical protein PSEUDO9AG_60305 [Pseudomonas sp. 9Ag]|nr:hypothetical protein PSEUDO9AG_60305 [Pseudomonas sp. 9Ag]
MLSGVGCAVANSALPFLGALTVGAHRLNNVAEKLIQSVAVP